MNDSEIRENFHKKNLRLQHAHAHTLVIDELGLNHGKCRADIAVINGHLVGYEIKSNKDSLRRLEGQVDSYNAIFDKAFVVVGDRYVDSISNYIPEWWGIIVSEKGPRGAVNFHMIRKAQKNEKTDPLSIARLLWRREVIEILSKKEIPLKSLRKPRAVLYEYLTDKLTIFELKKTVRECLKKRKNWRCLESTSRYDGLCQPVATL
jgi:hypothetical protein